MAISKKILSVIVLFFGLYGAAQDRYMVFFEDKVGTPHIISQPESFLSTRAIERRQAQDILITEADLPVSPVYLQALRNAGAKVFYTSRWMNAALVEMTASLEADILALNGVASIEYVAPGAKLKEQAETLEPPESFNDIPAPLFDTDNQLEMLNAEYMHALGWRGEDVWIAVFDGGFTGMNRYKPFEAIYRDNRIIAEIDFVENSGDPYQYSDHGTRVVSCISAVYGNDFTGTAPLAHLLLAVTEDVSGEYRIEEYNWLLAAEFADSAGVDIINSSLGYTTFDDKDMDYIQDDLDGKTTVVARAAQWAWERGILVVNSAGNYAQSSWETIGSPADAEGVLSVAAVDANEQRASFSSTGPSADGRIKPDVAAKGLSTTVVRGDGAVSLSNGTSFAAPLIAGFAAALWSGRDTLTAVELRSLILDYGHKSSNPDAFLGYGIPRFTPTLTAVNAYDLGKIVVYPNPVSDQLKVESADTPIDVAEVFSVEGHLIESIPHPDPSFSIDTDHWKSGLYLLRLHSGPTIESIKLRKN
jgi:hypothetical protein